MSEAALLRAVAEIFSGGYDPVAAIVQGEIDRGRQVIRPGNAPWLSAADWNEASVASISGTTVRLVLIHAKSPGSGAFTRTLAAISEAGMVPAVIDPTAELASTLRKRGWKARITGNTFETREWVWRPRGDRGSAG